MRRPPAPPAAAPAVARVAPPTPAEQAEAATPTPAPARASYLRKLMFHGSAGTLFGIYMVNVLLTIVTLGFYRFWGRVRV